MGITRRGVQIGLGLLWLLDGTLQLQHQMFSKAFASQVIALSAEGQPGFVSGPIHFGEHIFLLHPAIFNTLFAVTQLSIGALILWKRTTKLGLLGSVGWGVIVWAFGEGYGGIFSTHTLLLMGAPGAVMLYIILALAVMPTEEQQKGSDKQQIAYWLVLVWTVLWIGGGVYQLLPGQDSVGDVSTMILGSADGAPKWLATIDTRTGNFIQNLGKTRGQTQTPSQVAAAMHMSSSQMLHMTSEPYAPSESDPGYWFILLLAAVQVGIGVGVLFRGVYRNTAIVLGIACSLVFWVVGQSLGGYYTGLATDPNSGPLFVLLGLAIVGCTDIDQKLSKLTQKIEYTMIGKPKTT